MFQAAEDASRENKVELLQELEERYKSKVYKAACKRAKQVRKLLEILNVEESENLVTELESAIQLFPVADDKICILAEPGKLKRLVPRLKDISSLEREECDCFATLSDVYPLSVKKKTEAKDFCTFFFPRESPTLMERIEAVVHVTKWVVLKRDEENEAQLLLQLLTAMKNFVYHRSLRDFTAFENALKLIRSHSSLPLTSNAKEEAEKILGIGKQLLKMFVVVSRPEDIACSFKPIELELKSLPEEYNEFLSGVYLFARRYTMIFNMYKQKKCNVENIEVGLYPPELITLLEKRSDTFTRFPSFMFVRDVTIADTVTTSELLKKIEEWTAPIKMIMGNPGTFFYVIKNYRVMEKDGVTLFQSLFEKENWEKKLEGYYLTDSVLESFRRNDFELCESYSGKAELDESEFATLLEIGEFSRGSDDCYDRLLVPFSREAGS